jgi:predicted metalloprotease with PDZ domain
LEDLERELNRVRDQDAKTILFEQFARVKSTANNPNWFRQMLIANLGLKQPHPLARLAKEIGLDAKTLRREVRKMGVKRGAAGRPKAG